jgi:prepilin-type N-terminal cleavage/methylation domain-containing protein
VAGLLSRTGARVRGRIEGFTLLETLVAVSIFGTVVATIYLSFSTGMEAQSRIETSSKSLSRASFALDLVASDLQSPGRIGPGALEGWDDGFRLALKAKAGYEDWVFSETQRGAETLEYRLIEGPDAVPILVRRLLRGEEVLSEIQLVSGVRFIEIEYFMSDLRGLGYWVSEWEPEEGLPYAVRLRMGVEGSEDDSAGYEGTVNGDGVSDTEYRRLVSLAPSWLRPPVESARSNGNGE